MNSQSKIKVTAVVVAILFLISLGGLTYYMKLNQTAEEELHQEKLRNENLLSEKLDLDKQIKHLKTDMLALQGKNKELDQFLKEANQKVTAKEQTIAQLAKENAGLQSYKKENEAIKKMREELLAKVEQLGKTNAQLTKELEGLNKTLNSLKDENSKLTAELNSRSAKPATSNFRIESIKKRNDKLTIKSRKTNSLQVSFDIENVDKVNYEKYRLILRKPEGGDVKGEQKVTFTAASMIASAQKDMSLTAKDRINFAFTPSEKLREGIYTVFIYDGKTVLGSAQVRLLK